MIVEVEHTSVTLATAGILKLSHHMFPADLEADQGSRQRKLGMFRQ